MAKMKTEFETMEALHLKYGTEATVSITPSAKRSWIAVHKKNYKGEEINICYMSGKQLEHFAVNILKALGSKKLK